MGFPDPARCAVSANVELHVYNPNRAVVEHAINIGCVPDRIDDFEKRLQIWKQADAEAARADQEFRRALLDGAQADHAEELHGEVLRLRAHADRLITELLHDMARLSGNRQS